MLFLLLLDFLRRLHIVHTYIHLPILLCMKRLLPSFFILLTLVSCTIQKEDFLANHDSKIAVKPVAERMSLDDARSVNTQSSTSEGVVE